LGKLSVEFIQTHAITIEFFFLKKKKKKDSLGKMAERGVFTPDFSD
jgi:hypothetical protein